VNSTTGLGTVSDVERPDDERREEAEVSCVSTDPDRVAAFLAADPELDSRLPAIEEKIRVHFGPETRVERTIFSPMDEDDAPDEFHLDVVTQQTFDEKIDHLRALIGEEQELMAPVRPRLTIGIL
jgi:hypothetical protein